MSTDDSVAEWWRTAVIYQVYPRSFADSDGDGIGDLPGIIGRLEHLSDLGVDALWLSPFYTSPQADMGYDVADYCDVDPVYGTLDDAATLITRAHDLGLRVIVDIVPNHCSSAHPRFQAALTAGPGSDEREWFIFRDGRGENGELPPNNWPGSNEGRAWTRVSGPDGAPEQWYLHLFDPAQPDWNWDDPRVADMFDGILRFWLDRGVDGFRVDVSHGMVKEEGLPDFTPGPPSKVIPTVDPRTRPPMWDQDGVHAIHRRWRSVVEEYGGERILVAEAWLEPSRGKLYVRPDEMHQSFNFPFLDAGWDAQRLRAVIDSSLAADASVGAPTTWVLSNHDVIRHASRFGYPPDAALPNGVGANDPQLDRALGLRRARAASLLMLALPGSAYLYQGEELGLPEVTDLPDDALTDYIWFSTGGAERGRDGCRVPLPWTRTGPSFGFGPSAASWLPQPDWFADYAVDVQQSDPQSTLEMYRHALAVRRSLLSDSGEMSWLPSAPAVLAFRRGQVIVVTNAGDEPAEQSVPEGASLLISSSGDIVEGTATGRVSVPGSTTAWFLAAESSRA